MWVKNESYIQTNYEIVVGFTALEKSVMFEFSTHHDDNDSYRSCFSEKIDDDEFLEIETKYANR